MNLKRGESTVRPKPIGNVQYKYNNLTKYCTSFLIEMKASLVRRLIIPCREEPSHSRSIFLIFVGNFYSESTFKKNNGVSNYRMKAKPSATGASIFNSLKS
jgi:hypothetical protein